MMIELETLGLNPGHPQYLIILSKCSK